MATLVTRPTQEISSVCLPENQQPQNWLVTKAPHRTVGPRMGVFVSARTITLVRDPRSHSSTVSGLRVVLRSITDNLFFANSSKRKRFPLIACRISAPVVEILINLRSVLGGPDVQGLWDLKGCALAITYESDVSKVKPEDFTIFSVNHTCVWYKDTDFQVPARMPPCPEGGCICAWFWIHSEKSGGEQSMHEGSGLLFVGPSLMIVIGVRLHERIQV